MEKRGWFVKIITASLYLSGMPDLYASHRVYGPKFIEVKVEKTKETKGCICGEVLKGLKTPLDCQLFKKKCTPTNPVGACMVSSEGTCSAYYKYE